MADVPKFDIFPYTLSKNSVTVGTYFDGAFQLSINADRSASADPLLIPCFDVLGFQCIPHIGVYGDDYEPYLPLALIKLPLTESKLAIQLPKTLAGLANPSTECYIEIHPMPQPGECQKFLCSNTNEINMMYHAWTFPNAVFSEDTVESAQVSMGVFSAHGINAVHQDLKDAGIAFEALEERTVTLHGERFSPENAQFQLTNGFDLVYFWAFASVAERRVVSFHVIPTKEYKEEELRRVIAASNSLADLLQNIAKMDSNLTDKIDSILRPLAEYHTIAPSL